MAVTRTDPKTLYKQALKDMKNKDFEQAIEKLHKAKNELSTDAASTVDKEELKQNIFVNLTEAYLKVADKERSEKKYSQAEQCCNRIIGLYEKEISNPPPLKLRRTLVFAYIQLGKIFSSKQNLEQADSKQNLKQADSNFEKARQALGEEEFDSYHYLSGLIFYGKKEFRNAFTEFSKHSHTNPSSFLAHNYKGLCLQNLKNHREAINCFQKAETIAKKGNEDDRNRAANYKEWAKSCCELKEYKEAIRLFNEAYHHRPSLGLEVKDFINAYDKVSENNIIYVAENMEVLLEYKPEDPEIKKQLARVYGHLGKHYSDKHSTVLTAISYFKKSLDLDATNEDTKTQYIKALMAACINSRDFSSERRGQYFEEIAKLLNWDFSSIKLEDISKGTIFSVVIKQKSRELKIWLLKACLNPSTPLGKRMWDQDGYFECSLTRDGSRLNKIMKELQSMSQGGDDLFSGYVCKMIENGDLEQNDGYKKFADVKHVPLPHVMKNYNDEDKKSFLDKAMTNDGNYINKFYMTQRGMAVPNHGTGELEKIKNAKNRLDGEAEIAALDAMPEVVGHYYGNGPRPNPVESGQPPANNNAVPPSYPPVVPQVRVVCQLARAQ